MTPPTRARATRDVRIDRIKACAILTVPLIHAGRPPWWSPEGTLTDLWLCFSWTIFAVPAFVMVSGRLHRTNRAIPWEVTWQRMQRVLVPYLVCCGMLYALRIIPAHSVTHVVVSVASGDSYSIYYYVPVILVCIAVSALLSRLPRWTVPLLWLIVTICSFTLPFFQALRSDLFWGLRDPIGAYWLGFLLLGWLDAPAMIAARVSRWVLLAAIVGYVALVRPPAPIHLFAAYAVVVVALLWDCPLSVPGMRFLSEASFAIYLWHLPFELAVRPYVRTWTPVTRIATTWLTAMTGTVAICLAARALLGRERARFWVGA